jgi:hypothetical protein
MPWILAQLCTVLALTPPALAQTGAPPITSNRPGISESESLLPPKAFQLESGFTFAKFDDGQGRHSQVDLPEATLRFGLAKRFEAFVNASNLVWNRTRSSGGVSTAETRGSDLSLNAKVGLLSEDPHPFTLSAAMGVSLPVGSEGESSGGYEPSLRLLWAKALPGDFGMAGNLDVSSETSDGQRHAVGAASIGFGHRFVQSTAWFVELFGDFAKAQSAQWQFDGGLAIVARPDLQLDISAGRTLQRGPPEWFFASGLSLRHRRR